MYHNTHKDVLEASDITAVHALRVERRTNGRRYAHLLVEIGDHKDLNEGDGVVKLHVTDGVTHVIHPVTPLPEDATEAVEATSAAESDEEETASDEEVVEEVKPATRRSKR
jgi:hypothetical protein